MPGAALNASIPAKLPAGIALSMPPLCTEPAVSPCAIPALPPPSSASPAAAVSVSPPACAREAADRAVPSPPVVGHSRSASLRATLEALSPQQRAAIDQAIFFGMDLRTACALCGKEASGSTSPSVGSSARAASGQPPPPAAVSGGAATSSASDGGGGGGALTSAAAAAAPAAAPAVVRLASCCELSPPAMSSTPPHARAASSAPGASGARPPSGSSSARGAGSRQPPQLALLTAARLALAWGKSASASPRAFLAGGASRLGRAFARLLGRLEAVLAALAEALEALAVHLVGAASRYLDRVSRAAATATGLAIAYASAWLGRTVLPTFQAAADAFMHRLHQVRRHRTGRTLSNGGGALASLAATRAIVLGGPIVGSMLAAPLRLLYVAMGLEDMRMLLLLLLVMLGGLLRLYRWAGWI